MKTAIFTIAHNESIFLPIWLRYYKKHFENVYVLNHKTEDSSIEDCKKKFLFEEVELAPERIFNQGWLCEQAKEFQRKLLRENDIILFAEADEIIAPDPATGLTLKKYIEKMEDEYVSCYGFEVWHDKEVEPPLDLKKKILLQRKFWYHYSTSAFDKPLLSRRPLNWGIGFHNLNDEDCSKHRDDNLYLIHLKKMDWDLARKRFDETGVGTVTDTPFEKMFAPQGGLEEIPERFKEII